MNKVTRRRHTPEFKVEAVALVEDQGYKVADAARALGLAIREPAPPLEGVS